MKPYQDVEQDALRLIQNYGHRAASVAQFIAVEAKNSDDEGWTRDALAVLEVVNRHVQQANETTSIATNESGVPGAHYNTYRAKPSLMSIFGRFERVSRTAMR